MGIDTLARTRSYTHSLVHRPLSKNYVYCHVLMWLYEPHRNKLRRYSQSREWLLCPAVGGNFSPTLETFQAGLGWRRKTFSHRQPQIEPLHCCRDTNAACFGKFLWECGCLSLSQLQEKGSVEVAGRQKVFCFFFQKVPECLQWEKIGKEGVKNQSRADE